jgi:PadR family transcriptional regulator PadR
MTARTALLLSLTNGPNYGLSLMENLAKAKLKVGQGTIYPLLRSMEREGLLVSEERAEALVERGGRPRIYYRLTKTGQKAAKDARRAVLNLLGIED